MNLPSAIVCFIFLPASLSNSGFRWTESTFEDFRDGAFLDAGSNIYVSRKGRIQIINRWDLNQDGFPDIVMPPGHGHTEKENTYIYLNNGVDIDGRSLIELPGNGSSDGFIEDLNRDGFNDLVVANLKDSHYGWVNAYVYYGSSGGFSVKDRIELPAYHATGIVSGDFNADGWRDLAIACQWREGEFDSPYGPEFSFVYWNSSEGFSRDRRLPITLNQKGAIAVAAGDLDGDSIEDLTASDGEKLYFFYSQAGWTTDAHWTTEVEMRATAIDIGDVNQDDFPDLAVCSSRQVVVLMGSEEGHEVGSARRLTVSDPRDVVLADCDADGLDDVVVANFAASDGAMWTESYLFYSDGDGFTTREHVLFPTLGAAGVSAGDLNGDGLPEIVFSNSCLTFQNNLLSYVFWNDKGSFRFGRHTQLPTQGSVANAIGDVNNDGMADVVFFNDEGHFRDGPATARIYWGDGTRDFSRERSLAFPTCQIFGFAHADLDDDGHVDLILAQDRLTYRVPHEQSGLIILWGDGGRFQRRTHLPMTQPLGGLRIADLNSDGYLDLVPGGTSPDPPNPESEGLTIFWGGESGYSHFNRSVLPFGLIKFRTPLLMDLDRDGFLDIVGQIEEGKIRIWRGGPDLFSNQQITDIDLGRDDYLMYIKAADFNRDGWLDLFLPKRGPASGALKSSFIYFGSPGGLSSERRVEVDSYVAYQNSIADLDRDGWLDLFICSYGGEFSGNRPSLIHWGNGQGFSSRPSTTLPTFGASGSETLDYDGDGWTDILVANHRRSGSTEKPVPHRHVADSMLYWGGPEGYSPENRLEFQTYGPSGLNVRDAGNSYDRGLYEDYVSSPFQIPNGRRPAKIAWEAETPHGTSLKFQIRASDSKQNLENEIWVGPEGPDSWFDSSDSPLVNLKGSWIAYRARLSTPNGGPTPYLKSVTIEFE